ncbi:MAG: aminotransferase class V-fold PLP-dependent enzyme [Chthonomonadaceae bacterium]|nr:aminotransferase class V-fold PLP-dependent enzyme [Chthonomonadaceae bacterium]
MLLDIERARRETPGCAHMLHFNNAGASLPPQRVTEAMVDYLRLESEIGGYEAELQSTEAIGNTYAALATMLHCRREEIAYAESATRAWDMAFYGIPLRAGDRILTGRMEYGSNWIAMLQRARQTGAVIEVVPSDETGQIDVEALKGMVDERAKLIALTHVPTNGGLVNPAAEVGKVARQAGILYLLDACQSVGQMPLDVEELGCDFLSATGRKFLRGPRGTGFLYVRESAMEKLEPPFLDMFAAEWVSRDAYRLQPDARRFEAFEANCAAKISLGVAVDYALQWGLDAIQERIRSLATTLRTRLASLPSVTVHDLGQEKCGIVTFTVDDHEPWDLRTRLAEQRIHIWTSNPGGTRLDMEARHLTRLARASVHYYNTEAEIDRFCTALMSTCFSGG